MSHINKDKSQQRTIYILSTAVVILLLMISIGIGTTLGMINNGSLGEKKPYTPSQSLDWTQEPARTLDQAIFYDLGQNYTMFSQETKNPYHQYADLGTINGCTPAVVVEKDGEKFILTAGHCIGEEEKKIHGVTMEPYEKHFTELGDDFGWFKITDGEMESYLPSLNGKTQVKVTGFNAPHKDQSVCTLGSTSGWTCGKIVDIEGTKVWTDFCIRGGDSGSGLFNENGELVAILSGGQPECYNNYQYAESGHRVEDKGTIFTSIDAVTLNNKPFDNNDIYFHPNGERKALKVATERMWAE